MKRFMNLLGAAFVVVSLLLVVTTKPSQAASGQVINGSSAISLPVSTPTTVGGISISGASGTVPVQLRVSAGTLDMPVTAGLTFQTATSGSDIHFTGSLSDVNSALASLAYTSTGHGTDTLEISLVEYGQVFYPGTGHIYEYVQYDGTQHYTWDMARTEAASRTKYGVAGYLATITSQGENDFVNARVLGAGWMAATDSAAEGVWRWAAGPENNQQFWQGNYLSGTVVGGMYQNWEANQPDNSYGTLGFMEYENCGQFGLGASLTGKWNDLPCSLPLPGYIVEYGSPGNLPAATAKNISLVATSSSPDTDGVSNVIENNAPNGGDANGDGTLDSLQNNVASFVNSVSGSYMSLETDPACRITAASTTDPANSQHPNSGFTYPAGLLAYSADCGTPGFTSTVRLHYYTALPAGFQLHYYNPVTHTYSRITPVNISTQTIGGQAITSISYTVADGGQYDEDGLANGIIIDPVGAAVAASSSSAASNGSDATVAIAAIPSATGDTLADTGAEVVVPAIFAASLIIAAVWISLRRAQTYRLTIKRRY